MINTLLASIAIAALLVTVGTLLSKKFKRTSTRACALLLWFLSIFPGAVSVYILAFLLFPERTTLDFEINEGVQYSRFLTSAPSTQSKHERMDQNGGTEHTAVVHMAKISLMNVELSLSANWLVVDGERKLAAKTLTSELSDSGAVLGVNGSFFAPFRDQHLLDYYPHTGDGVYPMGATFSEGVLYGKNGRTWPTLVVYNSGEVSIHGGGLKALKLAVEDPKQDIAFAVSGRKHLLENGVALQEPGISNNYPRTAVGLNKAGDQLFLFVVDGKQPNYSTGVTLERLTSLMKSRGVFDAIELDGGGSATMAWQDMVWRNSVGEEGIVIDTSSRLAKKTPDIPQKGKVELLNRPIHTKIPGRQRPVANHLLIYKKTVKK